MMKTQTIAVTIVAALTVLSTGFASIPMAHAHGVQAQLQSRFVRILDESFSAQTLHTGDTLTVTGTLQSLVNTPLRAWLSLFSDSVNAGNRWEFLARDPPGTSLQFNHNKRYHIQSLCERWSQQYIMCTLELNIEHIGPGLGPGQTVQVTGPAILKPVPWGNVAYQVVLIGAGLGVTFATRPWQVI